jgi:hypothetical protein
VSAQPEFEENASTNIARFAAELGQTGGGLSGVPDRDQSLDRDFRHSAFYGFRLLNRGNVYELLVPIAPLPDDPCHDVVVILDGQAMPWSAAMSAIRSRPSELREALDVANRPSELREALDSVNQPSAGRDWNAGNDR